MCATLQLLFCIKSNSLNSCAFTVWVAFLSGIQVQWCKCFWALVTICGGCTHHFWYIYHRMKERRLEAVRQLSHSLVDYTSILLLVFWQLKSPACSSIYLPTWKAGACHCSLSTVVITCPCDFSRLTCLSQFTVTVVFHHWADLCHST